MPENTIWDYEYGQQGRLSSERRTCEVPGLHSCTNWAEDGMYRDAATQSLGRVCQRSGSLFYGSRADLVTSYDIQC